MKVAMVRAKDSKTKAKAMEEEMTMVWEAYNKRVNAKKVIILAAKVAKDSKAMEVDVAMARAVVVEEKKEEEAAVMVFRGESKLQFWHENKK